MPVVYSRGPSICFRYSEVSKSLNIILIRGTILNMSFERKDGVKDLSELVTERILLEDAAYAIFGNKEQDPNLTEIAQTIVSYANAEKLYLKNPTEGDCAHIAGKAVKDLTSFFEGKGYGLTLAVTQSTSGLIPAYKSIGYGHHIINVIEGESSLIAFDLTASYTMPSLESSVLFIIASNEVHLREKLESLTGSRWEVR